MIIRSGGKINVLPGSLGPNMEIEIQLMVGKFITSIQMDLMS